MGRAGRCALDVGLAGLAAVLAFGLLVWICSGLGFIGFVTKMALKVKLRILYLESRRLSAAPSIGNHEAWFD